MRKATAEKKPVIMKIGPEDSILYTALDPTPGGGNLGRAMFVFCPIWKKGIMTRLMIYPRQQRTGVFCYDLNLRDAGRITTFCFHSWEHKSQERPWPWRMGWCSEHDTVHYEVYVPTWTGRLSFIPHFGDSVDIHFGAEKE